MSETGTKMSEEQMRKEIAGAIASKDAESAPGFEETWLAAEARYRAIRRRYRMVTGVAASLALIGIVIGMSLSTGLEELPEFELAASLMNSTLWSAPSDVLMPEYSIDIYQDVPEIFAPIDLIEGTLL